jgi:hypothetical protein
LKQPIYLKSINLYVYMYQYIYLVVPGVWTQGLVSSYLCFLHSWDDRWMHHACFLLVEMGSHWLLAWTSLKLRSSWSLPP